MATYLYDTKEWDSLIVKMVLLAVIIYGAVWLEINIEKRKVRKQEDATREQIIWFVTDDLKEKLHFIGASAQHGTHKPYLADVWDAILLGGKQTLLPFEIFRNLQHTYSWMKYYNNELGNRGTSEDALEMLEEVK